MTTITGRFAPSPSGPLHFGSLVAALASYCQAKACSGRWLLRIEDVDTPRVVAGAAEQILRDLEAFGFAWDDTVLYQSERFEQYQYYLDNLLDQDDCYACECSRRKLREQDAPQGPLGLIYPGNCRDKQLSVANHSIRLRTKKAGVVKFCDRVYGEFALNLAETVGDFVLKRVDDIYAYHLAVVIDDEQQGVNQIVRGADLLENTCLHIFLQQRLGFDTPSYMHIPLVNNATGVKLSKQTGANAIDQQNAALQLLDALIHLGQSPGPDLLACKPAEILQWAIDNWTPELIPIQRPSIAENFES
ncbi:MAG: tRNA glutamyl-Q(34) synthetase GluQRS [Gammaproteobacteria bacterium]|nr:tRNA glutamyl-Q(34) synthetase GluQRS [Gammaproteobacteria bacterium]